MCRWFIAELQEMKQLHLRYYNACHTGCRTETFTDVLHVAAAGCWTTTVSCLCRSCRRLCGRTRTSCSSPRRTPLAHTAAARCEPDFSCDHFEVVLMVIVRAGMWAGKTGSMKSAC